MQLTHNYLVYILLLAAAVISVVGNKLTVAGGVTGFIVGSLVFIGVGYIGIAMLVLFFILGTGATNRQFHHKVDKQIIGIDSSQRTAGQVLANGGTAAILGGLAWYFPAQMALFQLMIAGSLASATADTLSSELGGVYGRRFYDILTFKKVEPGPDGVVSLEGTLIGIIGAAIIAIAYSIGFGCSDFCWVIIIAGAAGNLFDSVLGATLERKGIIGNDVVNFLNTCAGAGVCMLLKLL
jgi:uncharacterized protein (TIGR00297 family)